MFKDARAVHSCVRARAHQWRRRIISGLHEVRPDCIVISVSAARRYLRATQTLGRRHQPFDGDEIIIISPDVIVIAIAIIIILFLFHCPTKCQGNYCYFHIRFLARFACFRFRYCGRSDRIYYYFLRRLWAYAAGNVSVSLCDVRVRMCVYKQLFRQQSGSDRQIQD